MLPRVLEVFVRAQQHQIVPAAQLDQQCVDRADLHAFAAAGVAHLRRLDVVFAVGLQKASVAKRSMICSPAFGPAKPCSNSCSTSPVVKTWSAPSKAVCSAIT